MNFCFHMTDDQSKLLVDLEVRIKQVMLLCDSLKEENGRLESDLRSKQSQLDQTVEELQQLKTKYDNLKMARTITAASVDVESAKLSCRSWCEK